MPEAESLCMCCSCAALCTLRFPRRCVRSQGWCVRRDGCCSGIQRTLSEEQYLQMMGRCAEEGVQTQDSRSICQHHHDRWLQHFKPTKCAACPRPLSSSGSMPCPEWMREQLNAQHGAFVHVRPCYLNAVAAKKQQASNNQPMAVNPENISPSRTSPLTSVSHALTQIHLRLYTHTHM